MGHPKVSGWAGRGRFTGGPPAVRMGHPKVVGWGRRRCTGGPPVHSAILNRFFFVDELSAVTTLGRHMDIAFYLAVAAGLIVWLLWQRGCRNGARSSPLAAESYSQLGELRKTATSGVTPPPLVPSPHSTSVTTYVPPTTEEIMRRMQEREERFLNGILDKYPGRVERHFYFNLAGTSHRNLDRTSRTAAIARCERGEELWLEHEPDNQYDPNAMAVYALSIDRQLGYLPARLAGETVRATRRGFSHAVYFSDENLHPETDRVVGATCLYLRLVPLPTTRNTTEQLPAQSA
jgi:hypothetical protein